jgi:hypothetical protein
MQRRAVVAGSGLFASIFLAAFFLLVAGVLAQEPASPAAPAIQLVKTVGTDPAKCAETGSITLPVGGGTVFYCYQVTNTGDITPSRHTLVDDQLGPILTDFVYSLAPGASVFLTQSAAITTSIVNTAIWTAYNPGPIDVAVATDSAEVLVTEPAPSIVLTKTVGTDPTTCAPASTLKLPAGGGDVTYCYEVTNSGNIALSRHSLVDDQLGGILTAFAFNLVPGASAFLTQTATVTGTTMNTATWTAYNLGPVNETASSASATVFVEHLLYLPVLRRE